MNEKLTTPVEVKTKQNRLLLYTKSEPDYMILLKEIQDANIAYHTYPLPTAVQPRLTLKGIPPTVEVEEIKEELEKRNLNTEKTNRSKGQNDGTNTTEISSFCYHIPKRHGFTGGLQNNKTVPLHYQMGKIYKSQTSAAML